MSEYPRGDRVDDHAHPIQVRVNRGGKITSVTKAGTITADGDPYGRGVVIDIRFQTEDGKLFTHRYQFHKGDTYLEVIENGEAPAETPIATIWRD